MAWISNDNHNSGWPPAHAISRCKACRIVLQEGDLKQKLMQRRSVLTLGLSLGNRAFGVGKVSLSHGGVRKVLILDSVFNGAHLQGMLGRLAAAG
jgi:hypothetical protein